MKKVVLLFLMSIILIIGVIIPGFAQQPTSTQGMSKTWVVATQPMPGFGPVVVLSFGECIKAKTGITVRVMPAGAETARLMSMFKGEAQFGTIIGPGVFNIAHGWGRYCIAKYGPQPIRWVWHGTVGGQSMYTRADAGIKTMADLKGRRIVDIQGNPGVNANNRALLAFANLTEKDVDIVVAPSSKDCFDMIMAGQGDAGNNMANHPKAFEMEASPHGIYWIPTPKENVEGWKRVNNLAPYISPYVATLGGGISKDNPSKISTIGHGIQALSSLPDEYAYTFTKAVWQTRDQWLPKQPLFVEWTYDLALDYKNMTVPYHNGTIKFFKEIGKWTPAMEQWQQKQVKLEAARIAAFPEALKEAAAKKIPGGANGGTPEFRKFWKGWQKERNLISYPIIGN